MSSKTLIMKHEAVVQLFWCFPFMPCKQIKCLIVIERSLFGPELWLETGLCRDCKNIQNTGNQNKPMNAALKSINKVWMMFDNTKIRWNRCLSIWTVVYWLVLHHMYTKVCRYTSSEKRNAWAAISALRELVVVIAIVKKSATFVIAQSVELSPLNSKVRCLIPGTANSAYE